MRSFCFPRASSRPNEIVCRLNPRPPDPACAPHGAIDLSMFRKPAHYGRKTVHHRVRCIDSQGQKRGGTGAENRLRAAGSGAIANGPSTLQGALPTMLLRNRLIAAAVLL